MTSLAEPNPTSDNEKKLRAGLPLVRWAIAYMPVPWVRWLMRTGERFAHRLDGVRRENSIVGGVPCEWLVPDGTQKGQVLLYLHGGGFVYGWSRMHRGMVADLARRSGTNALAVRYRLAPEHPFPAALNDCLAVYRALLEQGVAASDIVVAGDSAGGNLVLTTLIAARERGLPLPAGAACLSPVADFDKEQRIRQGDVKDALLHPRALLRFRNAYVKDHPVDDPLLSPMQADLSGFPPLLIQVGGEEVFRPDAEHLADAARRAGVRVQLEVYPGMWHVWQVFADKLPQAEHAVRRIAGFVRKRLEID